MSKCIGKRQLRCSTVQSTFLSRGSLFFFSTNIRHLWELCTGLPDILSKKNLHLFRGNSMSTKWQIHKVLYASGRDDGIIKDKCPPSSFCPNPLPPKKGGRAREKRRNSRLSRLPLMKGSVAPVNLWAL